MKEERRAPGMQRGFLGRFFVDFMMYLMKKEVFVIFFIYLKLTVIYLHVVTAFSFSSGIFPVL